MSEKKEIYADGIGQIHFAGGMVRYDFVTLQPKEDGMAPESQSNIRIIMPPQGFLAAFNSTSRSRCASEERKRQEVKAIHRTEFRRPVFPSLRKVQNMPPVVAGGIF